MELNGRIMLGPLSSNSTSQSFAFPSSKLLPFPSPEESATHDVYGARATHLNGALAPSALHAVSPTAVHAHRDAAAEGSGVHGRAPAGAHRRAASRASGRASAVDRSVATDILVNDKTFATPAPPLAMAVSRHLVWVALADGGCEVRNTRTAEVVRRFACARPPGETGADRTAGLLVAAAASALATGAASPTAAASADTAKTPVIHAMLATTSRAGQPQVWLGLSTGAIEVHDGETADLIATLQRHLAAVTCLAEFGGVVYSGGQDQQIIQWRVGGDSSGSGSSSVAPHYKRAFLSSGGHTGALLSMYAEGNVLVTGAADDTVKVWDIGSGAMQLTGFFHASSGGVTALCRGGGQTMWSGDKAGQLARWALRTAEAVDIAQPHGAAVTALKRAGERVYSASADGTVGIFCAATGRLLKRVEDQSAGWVTCVALPAELKRFVVWSASAQGKVRCWYQDEFTFMTRDHEQLNDAAWYRSGATPYGEFRRSLASRNAYLREQIASAEERDARVVDVVRRCSAALGGGGRHAEQQYAQLAEQTRLAEERRASAQQNLQKRKDELAQMDRDLDTTLALLRSTQSELNLLSPGYGDQLVAALPPVPTLPSAAGGLSASPLPSADAMNTALAPVPAPVPAPAPALALAPMPTASALTALSPLGSAAPSVPVPVAVASPFAVYAPPPPPPLPLAVGSAPVAGPLGVGGLPPPPAIAQPLPAAPPPLLPPPPLPTAAVPQPADNAATVALVGPDAAGLSASPQERLARLLAGVSRGQDATGADAARGVRWVNPNVGNYIQRRYYGASPSLRAPDVERRAKRQGRMPRVKVTPLVRGASPAAARGTADVAASTHEQQQQQQQQSSPGEADSKSLPPAPAKESGP